MQQHLRLNPWTLSTTHRSDLSQVMVIVPTIVFYITILPSPKVGWSSLTERRELHWHLFLYRAILGDCPSYISAFLEWAPAGPYHTRSSSFPSFKVPTVNSQFGRSAFSFCAPTTWNELQTTLKLTTLVPLSRFRFLVTKPDTTICNCF